MRNDLTNSKTERQNILNNPYALEQVQEAVGLQGVLFEGELKFTRQQVAFFYEVNERTLSNLVRNHKEEMVENGYEVISGNRLKMFGLEVTSTFGEEMNFPTKTTRLAVFNFRAMLNVGMLLTNSERARQLRSVILDIAIDTINKRTGGNTKYINQRDEEFIFNLVQNVDYHRELLDALNHCVDLGKIKYIIYSDKVYRSIFKEDAEEYRRLLRLEEGENERHTMYSEVLDLIASYEVGFAEALTQEFERLGRKLLAHEASELYATFEKQRLWQPLIQKARTKMASRDLCFRDVLHQKLDEYVLPVPPDDFKRFIGEKSMPLEQRLEIYMDALDRLKNRD